MSDVRSERQGRRPGGRAREIPALLFAALWLLGFEAGPALHLVRHATLAEHSHCHDGVCHDESAAEADADSEGASQHGENSLEHGGLAALTPAPCIASIAGVAIAEILPLHCEPAPVLPIARDRARARAPPTRAS